MKYFIIMACCAAASATALLSCEEISDTPTVNKGYTTNYRMPDPDILTDEDRAFMEAQEREYNENAK